MAYTVYVLTCKANGKKYVGMTSREPEKRWVNGFGYYEQRIYPDIKKYGWDAFEKEIAQTGMEQKEAAELERKLIKEYDSANEKHGYNRTIGGETLGGSYWIEETNKLRSISKMGEKNPNYGKPGTMKDRKMSEEARKKISAIRKDIMKDPVVRAKFLKAAEEARARAVWTPEKREHQKEAVRKRLSKKCLCVTTGEVFNSATEAAKKVGTTTSCVARVCRGERKNVLGLAFQYV